MIFKNLWKRFIKVMFAGKFCSRCGLYDAILIKEDYPESHYKCPNCNYGWIEINSLLDQWIHKKT